ncbi:hypothetical protein [Niabella soli]|uniref:hypothetical protein n=1 Tax=Niabella soli TaxID=446683 RepID=UPI0002499D8A|nr:hypothetical protein [Niabella soli]
MGTNSGLPNTSNRILTTAVFVLLILVAAWSSTFIDQLYWQWVTRLMKRFNGSHLKFAGKPFHLFPMLKVVYGFSIFVPVAFWLLRNYFKRDWLLHLIIILLLFIASTVLISWAQSSLLPAGCTVCNDGIYTIFYNKVPYDGCFVSSLAIGLFYLLIITFLRFKKRKNRGAL